MKRVSLEKRTDKIEKVCREIRILLGVDESNQRLHEKHEKFVKEYATKKNMNPSGIWKILRADI